MVKFIKKVKEKIEIRKLNKFAERLSLVMETNSKEIVSWFEKKLGAEGWRLIHKSEMDEILEQIDRAEENATAALKKVEERKTANAPAADSEVGTVGDLFNELFTDAEGGEK